jgi:hypothetical protein
MIPAGAEIIRHDALWQSDGVDWRLHPECRDACDRDGHEDFTLFDNPRGATLAEQVVTVPKRTRRSDASRGTGLGSSRG